MQNHIKKILDDLYFCKRVRTNEEMVSKDDFVPAFEDDGVVECVADILADVQKEAKQMELCEILTHIYGHNNWHNPYRNAGFSIGGSKQTPFDAYQELDEPFQRIAISLFGRRPQKDDGLKDLSAPIEY